MKGVMRFGKKGKLSPQYIGPYSIVKKIGNISFELEFPSSMDSIHPVFYVSMLGKCVGDTSLVVLSKDVGILDSFVL